MRNAIRLLSLSAMMLGSVAFAQSATAFEPVTDEVLQSPADGDWLMWRRTLDSHGHSPLTEINAENVGTLQLAWARSMAPGNQETTPLIHDGVMYIANPGDVIQALDAATGALIWEYRRELPEDLDDYVSANDLTRNIAIHGNLIIHATGDKYMIALNAETGALEWETEVSDYRDGSRQSSGPIIADGKIISGRSCRAVGGPSECFIAAHDATSGELLWRTQTVAVDGEAGESWGDIPEESRWHVGTWMVPSYDPELNLIYYGTSVTHPYSKFMLGLNTPEEQDIEALYQTSTLAIDADTGEIVWFQQHIRDQWDMDHPYERILIDTAVAPNADEVRWINPDLTPGEERKVISGIPGKTGIFYTIDRETGEFLWARETVYQNVVTDIDPSTGRATMNYDLFFTEAGQSQFVCPAAIGGKDFQTGTYNANTNVMFYPLQNLCMNAAILGDQVMPSNQGLALPAVPAEGAENLGTIRAFDASTGEQLWTYEQRAIMMSLVSTGDDLIFAGDVSGAFRAHSQEDGEILWETNLGAPVGGYPVSYEADGHQYVAVTTGAFIVSGSYLGLTPEYQPSGGNTVFVFRLPN